MRLFRFIIAAIAGLSFSLTAHAAWGMLPGSFPVLVNGELAIAQISASSLLVDGKKYYDRGQFSQARQLWQQAVETFATEGNFLGQAQAYSFLSLSYQRLGEYLEASEAIAASKTAIDRVFTPNEASDRETVRAQILNTEGRLHYLQGHAETALDMWQQATTAYRNANDNFGIILSQINQARAMQSLGLYRRATKLLEQIEQTLTKQPDASLKAAGLLTLADLRRQVGSLQESERILQQALEIAKGSVSAEQKSAILLSLGNTKRSLKNTEAALNFYEQAEREASAHGAQTLKLEAQLNQLNLLVETEQWDKAADLARQIPEAIETLPASRPAIYAKVNLAKNIVCLQQRNSNCLKQGEVVGTKRQVQTDFIVPFLNRALQSARQLEDKRAESYALGNLGRFYQEMGEQSTAQQYTESALNIAQSIQAPDIAYQWQWQLGRLRIQKEDATGAIAAYTEAVNTLEALRSDLVAIDREVQFSFRESVEPLYRQLVGLLLDSSQQKRESDRQTDLKQARQTLEALQLAELDNFFKDACLDVQPQQIDEVDPTAAVIYPIILSDRLAVILSLPGQPLRAYETRLPESEIENTLGQLQQYLSPAFSNKQRLRLSQQVYEWLVGPAEADLAENQIKTLVFVLDGFLRNLPMAALHDGDRYLIEQYSIALTPGLQLLAPQPLKQEQLKILTGGITDARQGFSALPAVALELQQIAAEVNSAEVLLDREFTQSNLAMQIDAVDFPMIHLATHGQFSSNSEQTFILTWNDKIQVKEFEELLKTREEGFSNPIELLVLSACQTAAGDKRAGLGLAGVAVRSGARSTVATLWAVNDQSTATLMSEFYRNLVGTGEPGAIADPTQSRVSKAEALRRSQLALLKEPKYAHPFYWAPFVLVGNWL